MMLSMTVEGYLTARGSVLRGRSQGQAAPRAPRPGSSGVRHGPMPSLASIEVGEESFPHISSLATPYVRRVEGWMWGAPWSTGTYERIAETYGEPDKINASAVMAQVKGGHVPMNAHAGVAVAPAGGGSGERGYRSPDPRRDGQPGLGSRRSGSGPCSVGVGDVQPNGRDGLAAAWLIAECKARSNPSDMSARQSEFMPSSSR